MALNLLGIATIGSSSSSPSTSSAPTSSPSASSTSATGSSDNTAASTPTTVASRNSSDSVPTQIAKDSATVSEQARDALQGKASAPASSTVSTYNASNPSTASQSSVLTSVGADQRRAIARATSSQAVTNDAVSTIGSLSRMTQAYGLSSTTAQNSTIKNSFNRLFSSNATPGATMNETKASSSQLSSASDKMDSTSMS